MSGDFVTGLGKWPKEGPLGYNSGAAAGDVESSVVYPLPSPLPCQNSRSRPD